MIENPKWIDFECNLEPYGLLNWYKISGTELPYDASEAWANPITERVVSVEGDEHDGFVAVIGRSDKFNNGNVMSRTNPTNYNAAMQEALQMMNDHRF